MRYLRLTAASAIVALAALVSEAETHYKPRISIGARAGMSMSQISFSPSVRQGWMTGSQGALMFRYTEEKLFGLVAELGWAQRGWKEDFEDAPFSYTRTINYLQLPVMTHINFGGRRVKCFINLGPEFSYAFSSSISSNFDYVNPSQVAGFPIRNRMTEQLSAEIKNRFDYGITASIGGEFYVQPRHSVILEARFYYGLGNIFPSSKADTFGASRPMSIEFSAGYYFRLR